MSRAAKVGGNDDRQDGDNDNRTAAYEVGYARPPAEHRFQKGRSGNPKGRPKGAKNKPAVPNPLNARDQPTDALVLEEAYRPVTIREGDKVIELPAIQALIRALAISAMKGSRLSQQALAEIVREVEDRRAKQHVAMLDGALEYKLTWKAEIEHCERLGLERPCPIPDPDDIIIIDFRTGDVRTEGPLDDREKASYDERIARRSQAQDEVSYYADKYRRARSESLKTKWLDEWHFEQRIFDLINDSMPPRYKAKLENRSYRAEGSREGKTLREFVEDRKRPKQNRRWVTTSTIRAHPAWRRAGGLGGFRVQARSGG